MNQLDIRPQDLTIVTNILNKHLPANTTVWVFGSRAKGTARPFSDLDLAIDIDHHPLPLKLLTTLLDEFEESDLPYKVDIVDLNTIDEEFKKIINAQRKLLIS